MRLSIFFLSAVLTGSALSAQQLPPQQLPPQGDAAAQALPDEPGRPVARLSVLSGDASVRRGDSGDWVAAALNAPLMAGDSVSVAAGGAVELQLDYANFVRVAGDSEVRIADLENGQYQLQLVKGLLTYRTLRDANTQPEISTALIAVRPTRLSAARVEVFPDGSTRVSVRHGEVEIYTPKGTEHAREGSTIMVRGAADDPEYQVISAAPIDQWDTWNDQRDAYLNRSQSSRYVSQDVAGTEDLDAYGQWSYDPAYGNVWAPRVATDWAPYRNGQWAWEDYYGWTWVDADPWGWAPFHYGSWYQRAGIGWCWYPGERFHHYWWRPALVGFVGFGGGVGFGFGNIGWIPLAPFEAFHPWYGRGGWGRNGGFANINIVRNTNVVNVYRNARFANGVTAVSTNDFQRGNFRNPVNVAPGQLQQASLMRGGIPVTPNAGNLRFTDRAAATNVPRSDATSQRFFSRSSVGTGTAQRTPFVQQQAAVRSTLNGVSNPAPNTSAGSLAPRTSSAPGWQRFGSPQVNAERQQFSAPVQQQQRFSDNGGGARPLQVAPPLVHQRDNAPSYNAPRSYQSSGGFGAPAYRSAPAPTYRSAPAPAYRSAPAPSYRSAPAPSYRSAPSGGGGGGHTSSGNSGGQRGHR